jgi:peptide/nickel transport system substrate-binding protein
MTVRPVEFATLLDDIQSPQRRFDAVLLALQVPIRLDLRDQFHSASIGSQFQLASYRNPALDTLLDRAALTADRTEARSVWREIQQILRDDQPWTYLYYYSDVFVARDELRGAEMDGRGRLLSGPRWWLAPRG